MAVPSSNGLNGLILERAGLRVIEPPFGISLFSRTRLFPAYVSSR